ncbi:unnamed protein product [Callosobruchus maculatus]|uniref:Uncharacterized protein n=1 Tax=Callosobruchus maculatus TaxID=64391 RepID=A0A653DIV0_CALMS|nr:unnamed protein product [Callosobruchus maculatus]
MCSKNNFSKVLKEAHSGNIPYLKEFFCDHKIHWTELRYDQTGDTIIHCAARLGFVEMINFLLTQFSPKSVDCKNKDGKTALHEAAQFSNSCACEKLLEHGADVNALKRADWTPLMLACTKTHIKDSIRTVQILLQHGALVNCKNKDGWTCLHLVSREGKIEILKLLVEYGLDVKAKTRNGRTALHIAGLHGHLAIVTFLLDIGLDIEERDNCGSTALQEAILGGHIEICKELLKRKANVHVRNNADYNLLHLAASEGHLDLVAFLVDDLKFDVNESNRDGLTALHCAARKKHSDVCTLLLNFGSDYDPKDKFGRTPSDYFPEMRAV